MHTIMRRAQQKLPFDHQYPPILERIYASRGIKSARQLDLSLSRLHPYETLLNIDRAVTRLVRALEEQQRIVIVGDYDADGATSTALAMDALAQMGATEVDYLVPDRFTLGYGLSPAIIDIVKAQTPQLLITVDNGIASIDGVAAANAAGIDVIVTDHHLAGRCLPDAYVIVNPNQPNDPFPSKCLAGVGVIFYVMIALRARLEKNAWFEKMGIVKPNMARYLDLVALGTVADVVPLDHNNRILVAQGLRRIQAGDARPGINALIQVSGRETAKLCSQDLGFALGPRLNAAGRLEDMSQGIACLLAKQPDTALLLAQRLDQLNRERRDIEEGMRKSAFAALDAMHLTSNVPYGLCLYQKNWHQGIVGLIASRVKDKIYRPVIAFAKTDAQTLKGSARSIKGVHIRDVLDRVATRHPGLIEKFGGHAMAAGLSIAHSNFEAFKQAFNDTIAEIVDEKYLSATLESDGLLAAEQMTLPMAQMLIDNGPWGQGFVEPLFDGVFTIIDQRLVGEKHLKLSLRPEDSSRLVSAIAFFVDLAVWPNLHCQQLRCAYQLDINEYNGRRAIQLLIRHLEPFSHDVAIEATQPL